MSKYIISNEEFKTLAEVRGVVRSIRDMYPDGCFLSSKHLDFMVDLLKRHEHAGQKRGLGIQGMFVRSNPVFRNRGFWIRRIDGTETDFSFEMCLRNKPESRLSKFKNACRCAVAKTVIDFRNEFFSRCDEILCPITGEAVTPASYHVDHAQPWTFDKIVHAFIQDHGIAVGCVPIRGIGEDGVLRNELEPDLKINFIAYHNQRASLRILSPKGNLKNRRRGNHEQEP